MIMLGSSRRRLVDALLLVAVLATAGPAGAQLDETCTVSALNRSVRVQQHGVWVLPNVPTNAGGIRVRATCADGANTRSGQSGFFTVPPNGVVEVPEIFFGTVDRPPASLTISTPSRS